MAFFSEESYRITGNMQDDFSVDRESVDEQEIVEIAFYNSERDIIDRVIETGGSI